MIHSGLTYKFTWNYFKIILNFGTVFLGKTSAKTEVLSSLFQLDGG